MLQLVPDSQARVDGEHYWVTTVGADDTAA